MEKKPTQPMTPFDEITTPARLRGVKLLLPYTPVSVRQKLAVLIKFMELQHTMQAFGQLSNVLQSQELPSSPEEMLEELLPYLSPESASMLETFRNLMNMMEMVQMFQEMGGFSTGNENSSTDTENVSPQGDVCASPTTVPETFNVSDLMMELLSPQLKETFQMYQTMFSDTDSSLKGSESHERLDRSSPSEKPGTSETGPD